MHRISLLAFALVASCAAAAAQAPTRTARIGMLCPVRCLGAGYIAFDEELRKLGWIEGTNLTIERRAAEGRYERFPELAADLPIVFSFLGDAVDQDWCRALLVRVAM